MNSLERAEVLKDRTKQFAIRIVAGVRSLPASREGHVIGNQLLRSGTAVAANYRAVCRARSRAEFISKLSIVVEEADETVFWLELLSDTKVVPKGKLALLLKEANELLGSVRPRCARQSTISRELDVDDSMIQSLTGSILCITTIRLPRWKN